MFYTFQTWVNTATSAQLLLSLEKYIFSEVEIGNNMQFETQSYQTYVHHKHYGAISPLQILATGL
jgi:hypothetical protein